MKLLLSAKSDTALLSKHGSIWSHASPSVARLIESHSREEGIAHYQYGRLDNACASGVIHQALVRAVGHFFAARGVNWDVKDRVFFDQNSHLIQVDQDSQHPQVDFHFDRILTEEELSRLEAPGIITVTDSYGGKVLTFHGEMNEIYQGLQGIQISSGLKNASPDSEKKLSFFPAPALPEPRVPDPNISQGFSESAESPLSHGTFRISKENAAILYAFHQGFPMLGSISCLDVCIDPMTAEQIASVMKIVSDNPSIKTLFLSTQTLSESAADQIAKALKTNTSLKGFYFSRYASFCTPVASQLLKILDENHTITDFSVPGMFHGALLQALLNHLEQNVLRLNTMPLNAQTIQEARGLVERMRFFYGKFQWESKIWGLEWPSIFQKYSEKRCNEIMQYQPDTVTLKRVGTFASDSDGDIEMKENRSLVRRVGC